MCVYCIEHLRCCYCLNNSFCSNVEGRGGGGGGEGGEGGDGETGGGDQRHFCRNHGHNFASRRLFSMVLLLPDDDNHMFFSVDAILIVIPRDVDVRRHGSGSTWTRGGGVGLL